MIMSKHQDSILGQQFPKAIIPPHVLRYAVTQTQYSPESVVYVYLYVNGCKAFTSADRVRADSDLGLSFGFHRWQCKL